MEGLGAALKIAQDLTGVSALAVGMFLLYKLIDKWGGLFLAAQTQQTAAMARQASAVASLVEAVKEGQGDQREVLIAVRMLADRIERQGKSLEAIEQYVRERV